MLSITRMQVRNLQGVVKLAETMIHDTWVQFYTIRKLRKQRAVLFLEKKISIKVQAVPLLIKRKHYLYILSEIGIQFRKTN